MKNVLWREKVGTQKVTKTALFYRCTPSFSETGPAPS